MKLSAVIITFNEEKNIERCILSLAGFCNEIIVVDSFSTDSTKEICAKFPQVQFYEHKWEGYSQQKNYAHTLVHNNYILSIDADEALSKQLQGSISKIKETIYKTQTNAIAFSVSRITNYCGHWIHHCGWYPDIKIRIFHKDTLWQGTIHERLSFVGENTKIIRLKGDLLHYSYHSIKDHLQQIDKFTALTSQEAYNKGKRVSFLGMITLSKWKFIRDYIFKGGFLDGYAGYQVCKLSAFATYLKYARLREYYK